MAFRITGILGFLSYLIFLWSGGKNLNVKWFLFILTSFSILAAIILQIAVNIYEIRKRKQTIEE